MKKNQVLFVLAIGLFGFQGMKAADTNESSQTLTMSVGGSALIKIVDATGADPAAIALSLGGPTEAGASVDSVKMNNSTRLRMTSYTAGTEERRITANLPVGQNALWQTSNTRLEVALDAPVNQANFRNYTTYASEGVGVLHAIGDNTGVTGAQNLVTSIRTAWSGLTPNDGYVIRYVFSQVNQSAIAQPVASTTVLFTILADI